MSKANQRLYEEKINKAGDHMKIIKYNNAHDIDVIFDDESISYKKEYKSFSKGEIKKPTYETDKWVGRSFINKDGDELTIVKYNFYHDVDIIFKGYPNNVISNIDISNILKGTVKNPYKPIVCGVGYIGKYGVQKNVNRKADTAWRNMLKRCYEKDARYDAYANCIVCDEWHNFQNFYKWYQENYYEVPNQEMHIDKDLFAKYEYGRIYSPKTCCFLPKRINGMLQGKSKRDSDLPVGVVRYRNKYMSSYNMNNKKSYMGIYDNPYDAFINYKNNKEKSIKTVANEYKEYIPKYIYDALMNYEITYENGIYKYTHEIVYDKSVL